MARSGSSNFTVTRNDLIIEAYELLGVEQENEPLTSDMIAKATRTLNMMVKSIQAMPEKRLWKTETVRLFLQKGQKKYLLGSTGDKAAIDFVTTELSANAVSGASTIDVDSIIGISNGDNIGIVLDTGSIQWTTVNGAPSGSTITLTNVLTGDASTDQRIYSYTTGIVRPLRVVGCRYVADDQTENPIYVVSRQEYDDLPNKNDSGRINQVYYDPQLDNGELLVWNVPDDAENSLSLTCYFPLEDFDTASNNPDFPVEWFEALAFGLAYRLSYKMGVKGEDRMGLKAEYEQRLMEVGNWDKEITDVFIDPYGDYYRGV